MSKAGPAQIARLFGEARSDYAAAKPSRFRRTRNNLGGSADAHYTDAELWNMREYARDMDRNDVVIGQAIDRAVNNIIGAGYDPEPDTGDEGLNADLYARYQAWASDPNACDVTGRFDFHQLQWLAARHEKVCGDVFLNPLDSLQIELFEAHRCLTPYTTARNVKGGVLVEERTGRPLEYWFTRTDSRSRHSFKVADMEKYDAFTEEGDPAVFHVFAPKRFSMYRGITALHPILDIGSNFEDLNFAKLVQAQVNSIVGLFIERTADFQLGAQTDETRTDGTTETLEELTPGQIIKGNVGERPHNFSANIPNAEFFPHVKLLLTLLGINLGLPLVLMLMDASETNFSGFRGAVSEARLGFAAQQRRLRQQLHRPVWRWLLRGWLNLPATRGGLGEAARRLGPALFGHTWRMPKWPYIEPLTDAQADQLLIENLHQSPRRVLAERGGDIDDVRRETILDNEQTIRDALAAAQRIGDPSVTWRDLLFLTRATKVATAGQPKPEAVA